MYVLNLIFFVFFENFFNFFKIFIKKIFSSHYLSEKLLKLTLIVFLINSLIALYLKLIHQFNYYIYFLSIK